MLANTIQTHGYNENAKYSKKSWLGYNANSVQGHGYKYSCIIFPLPLWKTLLPPASLNAS